MVHRMGDWLELLEAAVIIGVLFVVANLAWQALSQAWGPVFDVVRQLAAPPG